jgi:hypothetical protein
MTFLLQLFHRLAFAHTRAQEVHEGAVDPHIDSHPDSVT